MLRSDRYLSVLSLLPLFKITRALGKRKAERTLPPGKVLKVGDNSSHFPAQSLLEIIFQPIFVHILIPIPTFCL